MAATHPPLKQGSEMATREQNVVSVSYKKPVSPLLLGFLIAMAVFPFIVGYFPASIREYLGALFR